MASTYIQIASVTVGSGGAAYIEFTSIPSTYTDLKVVASMRAGGSGAGNARPLLMEIKGVTTNRTAKWLYAGGSSAGSASITNGTIGVQSGPSGTAYTFTNTEVYLPNYASSNYKSFSVDSVAEDYGTSNELDLIGGLWSVGDAITSIKLLTDGSNGIVEHSTAYLYGIKKN